MAFHETPATPAPVSVKWTAALLLLVVATVFLLEDPAEAKRRRGARNQPPLQIATVTVSSDPFVVNNGVLNLAIEVQLPKDLDGATILEVSSLIHSPSKRSIRFLTERRLLDGQPDGNSAELGADPGPGFTRLSSDRVQITLTWDGTDQTRQVVGQGRYKYEIRAKLLSIGPKGPRTQMVSWPKRGYLEVQSDVPGEAEGGAEAEPESDPETETP